MTRAAARSWGVLRRRLSDDTVTLKLTRALEQWLGEPVRFERRGLRAVSGEPDGPSIHLRLRLPSASGEITVCVEPRLVTRLVNFALNREAALIDPLASVEPPLLGAAAAVAAKIIDDAGLQFDLDFGQQPLELPDAHRSQLDATLRIGTSAYPVALVFAVNWLPAPRRSAELAALGTLAIALPLVIGEAKVLREELARVAPGTAFLTGKGLWVNESLVGHAVLIAPLADRGLYVNLQPSGKIVLGESSVPLNHDDSGPPSERTAEDLTDTLFEAPVVVRVELGTVSLPAKDWALLRPGDIVETGQPLGAEVTLRAAGQSFAKGELLNVEGELGVRITKLLVGEKT